MQIKLQKLPITIYGLKATILHGHGHEINFILETSNIRRLAPTILTRKAT